jgi:ribosomal protein S18 acetylase RimI-like enzyme
MFQFSNQQIGIATKNQLDAILQLVNSAYRGESSRSGWTTEADLIAGNVRIDKSSLEDVYFLEGSIILTYTEGDNLIGTVNLQQKKNHLYLGMFSVSPLHQNAGIGKKLLKAAEEYALHLGLPAIQMSVISVRHELISWYQRNGYADTGERIPFKEDGMSGKHLRELEFMVLEKKLMA